MEAELVALATAGATALVQQMATDGWSAARDRVTAFFAGRGAATPESVEEALDTGRAELVAAQRDEDEQLMADVHAEWRSRLRRTLAADPTAAAELRALLAELSPEEPRAREVFDVHNTISGTVNGTVVQAGRVDSPRFGYRDTQSPDGH
ncbi:hypothetical protein [Streptomyces niveus]|uniref:hypothetical protein n=2 Tax=Streptomyces niveus TaxID=193462 RepID=UPI0003C5BCDE|nr:hypothetical protein [Streptomyces niveus]EST21290.1 hypothetical protein M877_32080 [Streptomyces niveus NCIMB 11891]